MSAELQLVWLAGVFGMRAGWSGRTREERVELFGYLTNVWIELGCPPYPVTASWYPNGKAYP